MIQIDVSKPSIIKAKIIHEECFKEVVTKRTDGVTSLFKLLAKPNLKFFPAKELLKLVGPSKLANEIYIKQLKALYNHENAVESIAICLNVLNYIQSNIITILIGEASDICKIVEHIDRNFSNHLFSKSGKANTNWSWNEPFVPLKKALEFIFDYKDFSKKKTGEAWDAFGLAIKLDVKVCPYCNRQYTFTLIKRRNKLSNNSSDKITRTEFDHYYSRYHHPYLAISLFNLIPSCHICNTVLKGEKRISSKTHIHPYLDGFENELKFQTGIPLIAFLNTGYADVHNSRVILKPSPLAEKIKVQMAKRNASLFELATIYNEHKDIVADLCYKTFYYDLKKLKDQLSDFDTNKVSLVGQNIDFYRFILGGYSSSKEFGRQPLSKFIRDIAEELGLLQKIENVLSQQLF